MSHVLAIEVIFPHSLLPSVLQKVEPDLPPDAAQGAHRAKERIKRSSPAGKTLERKARNCSA